jgi:ABC-type spermidine/putrescine transport system permease subunit I
MTPAAPTTEAGLTQAGPGTRQPRWLWPLLAVPGAVWLAVLFLLPFYVALAVAGGTVNPLFLNAVPIWNPAHWQSGYVRQVFTDLFGANAFLGPTVARTLLYVAVASALCLLIGYPVAYFLARQAGRRKGLYLVAVIAPFWVSYMMRMLAWQNLLQGNGLVNHALIVAHLITQPVNWLSGMPVTVIFGLVYGYVPYVIVVLYAGLDRIDGSLLEAARDLGLGRTRTFLHVTLPLSRQVVYAGALITALPMAGDFYTNTMLSGVPSTTMVGNVISNSLSTPGQGGEGAVLVLFLLIVMLAPMIWYVRGTSRAGIGDVL